MGTRQLKSGGTRVSRHSDLAPTRTYGPPHHSLESVHLQTAPPRTRSASPSVLPADIPKGTSTDFSTETDCISPENPDPLRRVPRDSSTPTHNPPLPRDLTRHRHSTSRRQSTTHPKPRSFAGVPKPRFSRTQTSTVNDLTPFRPSPTNLLFPGLREQKSHWDTSVRLYTGKKSPPLCTCHHVTK